MDKLAISMATGHLHKLKLFITNNQVCPSCEFCCSNIMFPAGGVREHALINTPEQGAELLRQTTTDIAP